jgi:ethanolaminephosphotransferase
MGRTNSIASIDLSNAYIGVDGYRPLVIGLTTFCSNWSGALWWCMAGWALAFDDDDDKSGWLDYCSVSLMVFSVVLAALSLSVTLLREHLFIWTVFSPKYLYQIAWTVLFFWGVQMVGGSLITGYWYAWSTPHHQQLDDEVSDDEVLDDEVVDDEVVNEALE